MPSCNGNHQMHIYVHVSTMKRGGGLIAVSSSYYCVKSISKEQAEQKGDLTLVLYKVLQGSFSKWTC